jgi:hypothetical protein
LLSRGFLVTAGGAILLIPRLLERGASADGLHQIPTDALFVSHNLFVMDPLVLARWGGLTALAAGPLLLLRGRKWWDRPWAPVAAAAALLTWIVALVPWIATWAWSLVSYLLVRTLRLVHTPWWWWTALEEGLGRARSERRWTSRSVGLVLALIGAFLLAGEVRNVAHVLREGTPHYLPGVEARLREMAEATDTLDTAAIIADPRTSYGLRSLRGGTWVTYPVAHASPNDLGIADRLTAYRELFDSHADSTHWSERWRELGGSHLLLHLEPTRFALGREFGWIPDAAAARSLSARLATSRSELVSSGDAWQLWRIEGGPRAVGFSPVTVGFTAEAPALAQGSHFDVLAVDVAESVAAPGDTLSLRIVLRAAENGTLTDQPDWEQVFVRLEGPMPTTPAWTRGFSKLYRKFFIEKKGRSASRFGGGWIPANGHTPPTRWPESGWEETRRLVVPAHVPSGEYTVQVTVQESAWRARRQLGDYLRDTDRYSAPTIDTLRIER